MKRNIFLIVAFVVLSSGIWCAFADSYPLEKTFRPSWYEYGWPFCFATAGRSHFNFVSVSWFLCGVDVIVCLILLLLSLISVSRILSALPRFSVRNLCSVVFAASIAFCFLFNNVSAFFELSGFDVSRIGFANEVGEYRPLNEFPPLISFILATSIFLSSLVIADITGRIVVEFFAKLKQ